MAQRDTNSYSAHFAHAFSRVFLTSVLLFTLVATSCRAETVRIDLVRYFSGIGEITVSASGDFQLNDISTQQLIAGGASDHFVTLKASPEGILVTKPDGTSMTATADVEVKPTASDGVVSVDSSRKKGVRYRGALEIHNEKTSLHIINHIDLEDYLLSAVASEMPSQFQPEALKAQAIAARTYSLANLGRHKKTGCDLCDEVHCQAYIGANGEKTATTQAVKDTAGMIMTYEGKPIYAQFSSDCGGRTKDGNTPYLKSVPDKPDESSPEFCSANSGHTWCILYTPDQLACALSKTALGSIPGIKTLSIKETDDSGRAKTLEITSQSGTKTISYLDFRKALGTNTLRSGRFTITKGEDGSFTIQGKGWGHGVGLCQHGANGMAAPPYCYTYEKILRHYYPGTEITKVNSQVASK